MNRTEVLERYDFDEYSRQPLSFYYCQSGFNKDSLKEIVVWTRNIFEKGSARLLSEAKPEIKVDVPLKNVGINIWGRQEWVACFSEYSQEGLYRLEVDFDGVSAVTEPFKIGPRAYQDLAEKAAKHYFLKRCGIWCHTHDADIRCLEQEDFGRVTAHRDVTGGWHDAHDDNKWTVYAWMAVEGLLSVQETLKPEWRKANEPLPYCLNEVWWEVEWFLKMQNDDGSFCYSVWEWAPSQTADGQSCLSIHDGEKQFYSDLGGDCRILCDRWGRNRISRLMGIAKGFPSTEAKYIAYLAQAIRHFSRIVKPFDAEISRRCAESAERAVNYVQGLEDIAPYQWLEVKAGLALYYLECYRDSGEVKALRRAESCIIRMLALQQPEGYFHSSENCRGLEFFPEEAGDERVFVDYPFGYVLPLIEYLRTDARESDDELMGKVQSGLKRFAEMLTRFCQSGSFGHLTEIRFDRVPYIIISGSKIAHGYNPYLLSAGVILAAAGRIFGERRFVHLAQRQLYWVLGANPRFMCFMNDEGVRNSGQYAAGTHLTQKPRSLAFYRHVRDMRWGITTGIFGSLKKGDFTGVWTKDKGLRMQEDQSPNYPNAGGSTEGVYSSTAQETWLNATGWFLKLLSELCRR